MKSRVAARLGWAFLVVWATLTLAFLVNHVLPADPARMVAGAQARPQEVEKIRQQLHLGEPLIVQYGIFLRRLVHPTGASAGAPGHETCAGPAAVHLDLGKSYQQRRPVVAILGERLPRTLLLAFAAILVQVILGISLGVLAAARRGTAVDGLAVGISLVGTSAPTFMLGLFLQLVFAKGLKILPLDGYGATAIDHLVSVVLPALTLGIFGAALYTRLTRDEMLGALSQDYVRTARAKGLGRAGVLRHAFRNALVPIVTVIGLDVGTLVGGAAVTETLFRWPGLGSIAVTSLLDRDGPLLMGTVLVTAVGVVIASIGVDVAYLILDPRVRRR